MPRGHAANPRARSWRSRQTQSSAKRRPQACAASKAKSNPGQNRIHGENESTIDVPGAAIPKCLLPQEVDIVKELFQGTIIVDSLY
jgi:hypothetical protein